MTTGLSFIPGPNAAFDAWQANFVIQVNLYKAGWNWNSDATAEWTLLTGPGNVKQARWAAAWAKISSKEFMHSDEDRAERCPQSLRKRRQEQPCRHQSQDVR